MNGIIHQCSHPNDEDVHFRITEEKIFADIFHYLEVLFRIIKPRKVFFMAVDGVAPRAKMNQQRGRRFRSAKEAEEKIKKALEKGEVLPTEARFDSNCITPGTEFMVRLHEQLKYFVQKKLSTDRLWQGVKVYLSGHETPGEGEHKIMEFIRAEIAKPNHNPNTRHCLYGLDADLIMLGLTSHEHHFSLLREEVRFGGKKNQKRITAPEETTFHLLHLSLLREYIDYEFSPLKERISFVYDLERILDDWILMGYLNENGFLNLARFEKYLEKLAEFDREHFSDVFVDLKWFESKVGNKYVNEAAGLAAEEELGGQNRKNKSCKDSLGLAALDEDTDLPCSTGRAEGTEEEGEDEDMFEAEFRQYKRTYYMTKMEVEVVSDEFLASQARCYVEGIQWILHYYYHGVQSWSWFYPYHYAPFLSDVRNIADLILTFDLGKPFLPFEQLLGVLPSASKELLPICYQDLMTSMNSEIVEYYPVDFRTDLNGKQQEWEAVVLIPFIDEKRLLAAMAPYTDRLTEAERFYKKKSGVMVFQQSSRGENMILEILYSQQGEPVLEDVAALLLGKCVFVNWPHLEEARVVAVSDGETKFFLEEASGVQKLYEDSPPPVKVVYLSDKEQKEWVKEVQTITEYHSKRKGVVINETSVLLYAQLLTGRKYVISPNGLVHLEKQWAKQILPFAHQTIVKDIKSFDSSSSRFKTLEELFPVSTTVFIVGNPYYGAMGEVQDSSDVISEGRVRVVFTVPCEPHLDALIQNQHKYSIKYSPGYVLASRLGITSYLVSRFSGSIFIGRGSKKNPHGEQRTNVGLNLKFNKKNEEVPGYTKRTEKEWLYSVAVEELLAEYLERFSELFDHVSRNSHDDLFYEDDIWPGEDENGAEKVQEITTWLKMHPVSSSSRASCDLQILDVGVVGKIEEELEKAKAKKSKKKVCVTVKPHLLFRPLEQQHGVVPDPDAEYHLFDRVINVRESFSVPLGLRGTIIGIKGGTTRNNLNREDEVLYEVLFDEEFAGGLTIRCSPGRGYRLPPCALINLSHGNRQEQNPHKLTAIVKPQPSSSPHTRTHKHQLEGLNHSPRSPFKPTQQQNSRQGLKSDTQENRNSSQKDLNQKTQHRGLENKEEEFSSVWQSLQSSALPENPPTHWQNHVNPEFEELLANLKISKEAVAPGNSLVKEDEEEKPLSPQSFAMMGTMMLKEMLKIDSSSSACVAPDSSELSQNSSSPGAQQQSRKRCSKKLAARMNSAPGETPTPPLLPCMAAELSRVCVGLNMGPPEFTFLRNRQGLMVCQVKLSNGLLLHGPQCQSETEAKEKAALFTLQRLNSVGSFPLTPPLFPGMRPMRPLAAHPQLFTQPAGGLLIPPQGYAPLPWGVQFPPQGQPFFGGTFPGARVPLPPAHVGSHNQFIPLQVTKKRVSGRKNQEVRPDFGNADTSYSATTATPSAHRTPPPNSTQKFDSSAKQPPKHAPGSASKRKHRKLAVNFDAAKATD
ncbi:5'-3' exoribonuclease 1 [Bagarius yarrelli]|uniref:5'-3' exoribonuclease 1 n=1 Tax=Bagarius yarrelli TaxID=175774 RepID=A0A556V3L2_BAGYA|nr:5'-3' exoribonuclease 1 [Bagarius yarrelli]